MDEDKFWSHPLGGWMSDCFSPSTPLIAEKLWRLQSKTKLEVKICELCDGLALSLLCLEIEPNFVEILIATPCTEPSSLWLKQKQFSILLQAIRRFYKDRLNQLIVMTLPEIPLIVRNPTADVCGRELHRFSLLILGCAVQCEKRKIFIERIQKLDQKTQEGLAKQIAKLTKGSTHVISPRSLEVENEENLRILVERLIRERDDYAASHLEMVHEHESDEGSSTTGTNSLNGDIPQRKIYDRRSPSPTMLDRHTNVELASIKAEVRRLRNETEEKNEEVQLLQDDLQLKEKEILRLQDERLELIRDARAARDLRDELDYANQKLSKVEKLEQENSKLREKLSELDYYRSRVEQLRTDCEDLEESSRYLETQLDEFRQKGRSVSDTEVRLAESQDTVKELHLEITTKNQKIEDLITEQTRLERELTVSLSRMAEIEKENFGGRDGSPRNLPGSLADQIEESGRNEITQLRLQNQKFKQRIEELERNRESDLSMTFAECEAKLEESEKLLSDQREENDRLNKQINDLENNLTLITSQYEEVTTTCSVLRVDRDSTHQSLQEARKNFAIFQQEVERKNEELEIVNSRRFENEISELRRDLEDLREELKEKEKNIGKMRDEHKSQRLEMDRLEDEKKILEISNSQCERQKRLAETERNALKDKLERLEDEIETSRMRLLSTDDARKRLETTERALGEIQNRIGDFEQENRALAQQLELETRKVQSLREDLVSEKSRVADLVGRLRSVCTGISLNGGKIDIDMDDAKLIQSIDDVIMCALNTARREADALRIQQHTQIAELTDLKRDIEKLRRAENASLNESDDRVRELSEENANAKEQAYKLQERLRELQIEIATRSAETANAKREVEELRTTNVNLNKLHSELATLQVSLRNAQLQEELLKQDNQELRTQIDLSEKSKREAKRDADQIASLHQALLSDHDRLQSLHDMLNHDYERAKFEISEMKKKVKSSSEKFGATSTSQQEVDELRIALRSERSQYDRMLRQSAECQNEIGQMRREILTLKKENECLARNCEDLSTETYKLRVSDQSQKATIKNLNMTIETITRQLENKELEMAKLKHKIDMLTQLNRTLEEENKNLGRQVEMLLQQNRELLNRALNDKDHYHQEQREFQEKLSNLRRHKEKLEEKIMDQYKAMESKKSRDTKEKGTLVKRAAKALIPKKTRSDKTSTGSTSTEDSSIFSSDEHGRLDEELAPTCSSSEEADRVSPRLSLDNTFKAQFSAPIPFLRNRNDSIGGSVRVYPVARRDFDSQSDFRSFQSKTFKSTGISIFEPKISFLQSQKVPEVPLKTQNFVRRSSEVESTTNYSQFSTLHERGVDVLTRGPVLPPKIPIRNTPITQSLRSRPPPPPYPSKPKTKPPPPYNPQRTMTPTNDTSLLSEFNPQMTSTPKSDRESPRSNATTSTIVKEGETRRFIREKEERDQKAMSLYENVSREDLKDISITTNPGMKQNENEKGNESTVWYEYGCI
ncbi:unnamed protein product, partial [Mesorhabditis belari]|uniref:HOOK N-terminal domain-containing protein n=1 Tax=Mesorhabditis belari TaxID=2138241 RepID=A0AAF3F2U9_9BILA